ncbi:hypothetical protein AB0L88_36835 [Saccharopolyspora shandongensis]|uniref:hypothetical protein n=1 Tax=Saccharopolyspora shandongensis TaxID=418495 RepID=UPI0034255670
MGVKVSTPGVIPWSDAQSINNQVRFDSTGPVAGKHHGAVFTDARLVFSLSLSDETANESARHIDDALHYPEKTFPSSVGRPRSPEARPLTPDYREPGDVKQIEIQLGPVPHPAARARACGGC